MFRSVQTATKLRLAAATGLVATVAIVAAIARFSAGSFSLKVLVDCSHPGCPHDRGDEPGGHGEDGYRHQRKRHGAHGVDDRLLRLRSWYFGSGPRRSSVRLLRLRPSPRSRMDEDLVRLPRPRRWRCSAAPPRFCSHFVWLHGRPAILSLGVVCASAVYLGLNAAFVAFAVAVTTHEAYCVRPEAVLCLQRSPALPFAFLGLGLGWVYLTLGAAVVPLLVVPILIARSTSQAISS